MKLRIQGNSIRFRLTKTEVDQFARQGRMEERVEFENGDGEVFRYALEKSSTPGLRPVLEKGCLTVFVPKELAETWTGTGQVGMESEDGKLRVLVEKDFARRIPRNGVDESDNYAHPNAR